MEVAYTIAGVAALLVPGWLFRRSSPAVGTLATALLWFAAAFLGSSSDGGPTSVALGWGAGLGAVGGTGFYAALRFEGWERGHPVDTKNLTPAQLGARTIGVPVAWLTFGVTIGGIPSVAAGWISVWIWMGLTVALLAVCSVLYVVFVRAGDGGGVT